MRLAEGGEHLAHFHQVLVELEMAIGAEALQAAHAFAGIVDARVDELVGSAQLELAEQLGILIEHACTHGFQRVEPGALTAGIAKRW